MSKYSTFQLRLVLAVLIAACAGTTAYAQKSEHYNSPLYSPRYYDPNESTANGIPEPLKKIGIEQRLGETLPMETLLRDEKGDSVRLGDFFNRGRPVIVAPVYFECPMLCNEVLNGLTGTLKGISFEAGKDFDVIAVSFDAREHDKPGLAANKKASYMERYARPGTEAGWHFLTGTQDSIDKVMSSLGFSYEWDEKTKQFAHAGGIMIATPEGRLSRYFYGIDYAPRDVKMGLMDSAGGGIGNSAEQLLLYCYHYDPATGKYGLAILNVIRLAGIATLIGLGTMLFVFWRRSKSRQ